MVAITSIFLNAFLNIFTELLHITKWCRWLGSYYFYFLPSFLPSLPPFLDFSRNIYWEPMLYQCYIKWFCESNGSFLFNNLVISSIGLLSKKSIAVMRKTSGRKKRKKKWISKKGWSLKKWKELFWATLSARIYYFGRKVRSFKESKQYGFELMIFNIIGMFFLTTRFFNMHLLKS